MSRRRRWFDPEIDAIEKMLRLLEPFDPAARRRVLAYVLARVEDEAEAAVIHHTGAARRDAPAEPSLRGVVRLVR
jgi:hypothetical protein